MAHREGQEGGCVGCNEAGFHLARVRATHWDETGAGQALMREAARITSLPCLGLKVSQLAKH